MSDDNLNNQRIIFTEHLKEEERRRAKELERERRIRGKEAWRKGRQKRYDKLQAEDPKRESILWGVLADAESDSNSVIWDAYNEGIYGDDQTENMMKYFRRVWKLAKSSK